MSAVSCCRGSNCRRQCQVVETLTLNMLREGEDGRTVSANCDGRDASKYKTYVNDVNAQAPGQLRWHHRTGSRKVSRAEPPIFLLPFHL